MFRRSKARKNGPLKAMQSVFGGDDNNNTMSRSSKSGKSSSRQKHQQQPKSKDDISMAHSQTKEKVKANPYATIKVWRPTSTMSSSTDMGDDVYQSFTNFDALRLHGEPDYDLTQGNLPPTGDLRHSMGSGGAYRPYQTGSKGPGHGQSYGREQIRNPEWPNRNGAGQNGANGFEEIPADYSRDNSPAPVVNRKVSFKDEVKSNPPLTNGRAGGYSSSTSSYSTNPSSRPPPLPSSPPPLPSTPPPTVAKSPPPLPSTPPPSSSSSKQHHDTSFQVVSDGATNSIKLVLSHKYTDTDSNVDLASKDVERLLAELKLTMDSLKTSRIDKNASQLSMCLSELHSQTKQFIQEAKLVVSSANNSKEKMYVQLEPAVHTLARLFLHGQATMLMMTSAHQAQHLGFQLIKAANAFKSTVNAANAAVGKTLNDPHMKYLMRQATNLASLLASLLNTIKEAQPVQ